MAKDRLDVHVRPSQEVLAPTLIVMEATGGYETVVASALAARHLPIAVACLHP